MNNYTRSIIMNGSNSERFSIPAGYAYLNVINNTDNILTIYQEAVTSNGNPEYSLIKVPQYQSQTIPINTNEYQFTVYFTDGGGVGTKKADLIFSVENLGMNTTLGTVIAGTITVGADGVGLARQEQLPAALGAGGGLKVERVDLGKSTGKATASGDTTIKASAGKVWAIVCITGAITVTLKDGATDKWAVTSAVPGNFPVPIACATSIVLNLSGVGVAYVLYE